MANIQMDSGGRVGPNKIGNEAAIRAKLDEGHRVFFFMRRNGDKPNAGIWFEAHRKDEGLRLEALISKPALD